MNRFKNELILFVAVSKSGSGTDGDRTGDVKRECER